MRAVVIVVLLGSSACAAVLEEGEADELQEPAPPMLASIPDEPAAGDEGDAQPDTSTPMDVETEAPASADVDPSDAAPVERPATRESSTDTRSDAERDDGYFPLEDLHARAKLSRRDRRRSDRACKRGRHDAHEHLARGHFGIPTMGLPSACRPELARRLELELDIVLFPIAGCVVGPEERAYERCYDAVMQPAIVRAHGPDAVRELAEEVCD